MPNVKVKIGDVYGKLTVEDRLPNDELGRSVFQCRCACGNPSHVVKGAALTAKPGTKSCGCSHADHLARLHKVCHRGWGEAAKHAAYLQTKGSAIKRGREWNITENQFHALAQLACRYCGRPPSNMTAPRYGRYGTYTYNGVDRIDPAGGYSIENCGTSCWICNRAKNNMTEAEFMRWINQVHIHSASSYLGRTIDFEI